jgi:hypothetical protein
MDIKSWLERQAPDFVETSRRFPLAITMAALNAAIVIGAINDQVWLQQEVWARAAFGLATGAVLAVAGVYFAESRPEATRWAAILKYLLPLGAVALFEVTDITWFVPYALPAIAILWLSVSPFTRIASGVEREAQQARFWIINHQALATAAIAAGTFGIIALGFLAIERSLSLLLGFEAGSFFYKWLLPFTGLFLSPVYWLSTLPKLSEIDASAAERPEFISRAVGFLGQFVLVPMLFIYALILLAYTAQIIVTQRLPEGMIGWMVMGFVIVGAATWLVLHPPFMREKPLVKLFRRLWFWLTLVPLGLFFFAVWVRVDAYGFTPERMLLAAGGVWAAVLAVIFLLRRGDIRVIPGLAAALLLALSVGPWNFAYLPLLQQSGRLDALVMNAGADKSLSPPRPGWSGEEIAEARGIIDYMVTTREGREAARRVMSRYGVTWDSDRDGSYVVLEALGFDPDDGYGLPRYTTRWRSAVTTPVPVADTPFYLQPVSIYGSGNQVIATMHWVGEVPPADKPLTPPTPSITLREGHLVIEAIVTPPDTSTLVDLDLASFVAKQTREVLTEPWIDFAYGGTNYRIAVESASFDDEATGKVESIQGQLFADRVPTPTP